MSITEKNTKPPKLSPAERRRRKDEQNRKDSAQYLMSKKHLLDREKENYTKLAFLKSNRDGWYKGWDHTAIIFAHDFAEKIGVKARLLVDRDYNYPARYGFVSIPNMEKVASLLSGLGVKKSYERDGMIVFLLHKKYKEEDIQAMLENEKALLERANQLVLPATVMPQLKMRLQELTRGIYEAARKMDGPARDAFGTEMAREAGELSANFYLMAIGKTDKEVFFEQTEKILDKLNGWLLVSLNIGVIYPKKAMRLMEFSNSARTQLQADMKKSKRKDKKDDKRTDK